MSYNGVHSQLPKLSDGAVGQKSAHIGPRFRDFISYGAVATPNVSESSVPEYITVSILCDTGSSQSLIKKGVLDVQPRHYTGQSVSVSGISGESLATPLYKVRLESDLLYPRNQEVVIGIADNFPVRGVQVLIGNDVAGPRVQTEPVVSEVPVTSASTDVLETGYADCLPSCVVTRAQAQSQGQKSQGPFREQSSGQQRFDLDLSETFLADLFEQQLSIRPEPIDNYVPRCTRGSIIRAQRSDPDLGPLFEQALSQEEANKVNSCYVIKDGLLTKKWRSSVAPADRESETKHLIVAPLSIRTHVLELAHDIPMSGHLDVRKIKARILEHFWWPTVSLDTAAYVRSCHTCQMIGKPSQKPRPVPLRPIPVLEEPFSELLIDIGGGPLPENSSGLPYTLPVRDTATRLSEAVSLSSCTLKAISQALLKFFVH